MPSKKKNSKTSSPSPSAVSSSKSSPLNADDEDFASSLGEASAKFPSFIAKSAFIGRIVGGNVSDSRGCKLWLSESAMVSRSIPPGSLVLFFEGMDDDGNLGNSGEFNKNQENSRKPMLEKREIPIKNSGNSSIPPNDREVEQKKNQEVMLKKQTLKPSRPQNGESRLAKPKPSCTETRLARQNPPSNESGPTRPKPAMPQRVKSNIKIQQKPDVGTIQKKPIPPKQKLDFDNEALVQKKLEVVKRKLQERYQAAEDAKKQRTIQVVELHDLPKKSFPQRNHQRMKTGIYNKNRPKLCR